MSMELDYASGKPATFAAWMARLHLTYLTLHTMNHPSLEHFVPFWKKTTEEDGAGYAS